MKKYVFRILAVAAVLVMLLPSAALAAPPVPLYGNPFPTWDSDMINIEAVSETGAGVYVAVLDTGLAPNWQDYFPKDSVATKLGTGFYQPVSFKAQIDENDKCGLGVELGKLVKTNWVGSRSSTHGTHVASTILGYKYYSNYDAIAGYPLPPIMVRGIAPDVTVIPVKVLADYQVPALPKCDDPGPMPSMTVNFGTSEMVAAGINYVTDLAIAGYRPMVINMSLGGEELADVEKDAIDRAIANGVIVVAAAGNEGEEGMGFPGAYAPVISVGASGWTYEWYHPEWEPPALPDTPRYRMWWLQSDLLGFNDIPEPTPLEEVYVTDFSSRELADQQLDVLAPGSWVRGPYPGYPGYAHLPWWSNGIGDLVGRNPGNFYYLGGTSMATPHVAAVAALMLEKNQSLIQAQVEVILKSTALGIPAGSASVFDLSPEQGFYTYSWGLDAVGAGLIQADKAVDAVP